MGRKSFKLERGGIYQKQDGGNFFFRYQSNGKRKSVSLKTRDVSEARKKAQELLQVVTAPSLEVIAAHVSHANFGVKKKTLRLGDAWAAYDCHPDKAVPATVSEKENYRVTWRDFLAFVGDDDLLLDEVTAGDAVRYADHLRTLELAVDTHNRKMRRLKKIFATLRDERSGDNPFLGTGLMRKKREEQNIVRRISFTKEQEQQLLDVLADPGNKLKNKQEIRVLFILGMFTGQRLKDCALLPWNMVNFERKRIWVKQYKTGAEVTIPVAEQLLEALRVAKTWRRNEYVLPGVAERYQVVDKRGKNVGSNMLNIDVMRPIRWIGLEPSVIVPGRKKKVTVYGFHSLRHSFASHCAEAGVPKAVAQSILGAASDIIDKYYVHIGEGAQQQALEAISLGSDTQLSAQDRIDQALAYIDTLQMEVPEVLEIKRLLRI
jgi:integrase